MLPGPNSQLPREARAEGKTRWEITGVMNPMDAQVLPGNRVLIAEFGANRVTERNLKGEILWEKPITWPVTPYYRPGDPCIDVTTGLGYPKKADDARANPLVSLLFSDPTGSGLQDPPIVLVQGSADVDDRECIIDPIGQEHAPAHYGNRALRLHRTAGRAADLHYVAVHAPDR